MHNEMNHNVLELIKPFMVDKVIRASLANDVVQRIDNGDVDPLLIHLQLKSMEDVIKQLNDTNPKTNKNYGTATRYKKLLLDAAEAHQGGKKFDFYNSTIEVKEVGSKYDYSKCEDEVYNDLIKQKEELDTKIKEREKMLQNIPAEGMVDPDNGNMIYRAPKSSTTAVVMTLK